MYLIKLVLSLFLEKRLLYVFVSYMHLHLEFDCASKLGMFGGLGSCQPVGLEYDLISNPINNRVGRGQPDCNYYYYF
jgi:hypothetical protein